MTDAGFSADDVNTGKPQSARMYDYFRVNRDFMHRASRLLAERGIRQFLDIGTGIPTRPNLHQVVQAINPAARGVYADNDPIEHVVEVHRKGGTAAQVRSRAEFTGFFKGLEPVAPGIALAAHWHPEPEEQHSRADDIPLYVGVARKP